MPTTYKGATVPLSSDLADGAVAFRDYTDSLPVSDAVKTGMVPVGTVVHNVRTVAPTGWLLLDGATVTGADVLYPELWAIVPAGWKSGANLVLPNSKGRILIAIDPADAAIDTAGELAGSGVLVAANLPPHTHTQGGAFTSGPPNARHNHGSAVGGGSGFLVTNFAAGNTAPPAGSGLNVTPLTGPDVNDHAHVTTIGGETAAGPGTSAPFRPPVLALNAFIRAA